MYVLQFFTGASNMGVFSTLANAQKAFAEYLQRYHYHGAVTESKWKQDFPTQWSLPNSPEVEHIYITYHAIDAELTPV